MKKKSLWMILFSMVLICGMFLPGSGMASASNFKGKTIVVLVPHGPGGGTDTWTRVITKHLPKYLPGNPTMVIRYMLGGGSLVACNYFSSRAPKDGLTLLAGSGVTAINSILQIKGVKYDYKDFPVILAAPMGEVTYTHADLVPNRTAFFDASDKLIFGSNPMPWAFTLSFALTKNLFEFETKKDILAYNTAEGQRAFLSKEIDIAMQGIATYANVIHPLVMKKEVMPLWQSGVYNADGQLIRLGGELADIPTVKEVYEEKFGKSPEGDVWKALSVYVAFCRTINKPLFLPPGAEKHLPVYITAAKKMAADPAFQKDAAKTLLGAPVYIGEEAQTLLNWASKEGDAVKGWLKSWLETGWQVKTQ